MAATSSSSSQTQFVSPSRSASWALDAIGQVVELAGLRRSDELGQEVAAAVVAGEADTGERGRQERRAGHDPQIAGQRQRQPATRRGPGQRRDGRLGDREQLARRRLLVDPLAMDRPVDRVVADGAVTAGGHRLDVTAAAEGAAGAGEHDAPDGRIELGGGQRVGERGRHRPGHRVARLGPVHRQRQHAVVHARRAARSSRSRSVSPCARHPPSDVVPSGRRGGSWLAPH